MRFRLGDEVQVTAGKDRGKRGKIDRVFPEDSKYLVAGINLYKKHVKQTSNERTKTGGVVQVTRPMPVGNLALICKHCTQPTRVGYKIVGDKKVRVCRKCEAEL